MPTIGKLKQQDSLLTLTISCPTHGVHFNDAGKKVSGIKRHIAVDSNWLPHMIHVTTADVTDRARAIKWISLAKIIYNKSKM